ncbi:hypothetical protein GEV33_013390 [Tenebrio molitor]|uniref:Odorant receptor n=1 Tax=Tenebrio molitor TaxID=7067 RepID=A0A8J6H7D1_TENMO|nr:hypothetical protein GEV33_013390 [Tenebrio molitor]
MEIETNEYEYESIASENEDVSSSSELCDDDTITIDSIDTDNVQEIEETDNDICGTKIYAKNIEDTCDEIFARAKGDILLIAEAFESLSTYGQLTVRKYQLLLHGNLIEEVMRDWCQNWEYNLFGDKIETELRRKMELCIKMTKTLAFCSTGTITLMSPSFDAALKSVVYFFTVMLQVALYFIPASNVEIEAENYSLEIYSTNWEANTNNKIGKHLLFMLMKSQKSLNLLGAGMLHVNRPEYLALLSRKYVMFVHGNLIKEVIKDREACFWDYNMFGVEYGGTLQKKMIICTRIIKIVVSGGVVTVILFCLTTIFDENKVVPLICWTPDDKLLTGLIYAIEVLVMLEIISPSFGDSVKSICYLVGMLFQVGLYFIITSNIEIEAENLSGEIYNINWEATDSLKVRKHILFMLMKSQEPLSITGGGMLHVNRNEYVVWTISFAPISAYTSQTQPIRLATVTIVVTQYPNNL